MPPGPVITQIIIKFAGALATLLGMQKWTKVDQNKV